MKGAADSEVCYLPLLCDGIVHKTACPCKISKENETICSFFVKALSYQSSFAELCIRFQM